MNKVRLPNKILMTGLALLSSACGVLGSEPNASLTITTDPDTVISGSLADNFENGSSSVSSVGTYAIQGPDTIFQGSSFRSDLPVDQTFKLVSRNMCYVVHVVGKNFMKYQHVSQSSATYASYNNDCESDVPATGVFFGPAKYGGVISVNVPAQDDMHVELLGFEVEYNDDCTGVFEVGAATLLPSSSVLYTRPPIKYRGNRVDAPTIANPKGGLYKFYATSADQLITLSEGENNVVLNALPWSSAWEGYNQPPLPPRYACGEEMTSVVPYPLKGYPLIQSQTFTDGSPDPTVFYNAHTMAGDTNLLDELVMIDAGSNVTLAGQTTASFRVECPTGASSIVFSIYEKQNLVDMTKVKTEIINCDTDFPRIDGSSNKVAIMTSSPESYNYTPSSGSDGDYKIFLAVPKFGANLSKDKARIWKFSR